MSRTEHFFSDINNNLGIGHGFYFIRSSDVKVFPCSGRGRSVPVNYQQHDPNNNNKIVKLQPPAFNFEARANTEFNYTHVIGQTGKRSFVIEWGDDDDAKASLPATLKFAIGGYYFEIENLARDGAYKAANLTSSNYAKYKLYAVISLSSLKVAEQNSPDNIESYVESTTTLASLRLDTTGLDFYNKVEGISNPGHFSDYSFTGLGFIVSETTPSYLSRPDLVFLQILDGTNICETSKLPEITHGSGKKSAIISGSNGSALGTNSIAGGDSTTAKGENSFAFGKSVKADKENQFVVGCRNADSKEGSLFVVGAGDDTPRTGFEVTNDNIYLQGIELKNFVVSKEELENVFEQEYKDIGYADYASNTNDEHELSHHAKIAVQAIKLVNYENQPVEIGVPERDENANKWTQPLIYFKDGFVKKFDQDIGSLQQPVFINEGKVTALRQVKIGKKTEGKEVVNVEEDLITAIEHIATRDYAFLGQKTFSGSVTFNDTVQNKKDISLESGIGIKFGEKIKLSGNDTTLTITPNNTTISGKLTFNSETTIPNLITDTIKANSSKITIHNKLSFEDEVEFASARGFKLGNYYLEVLNSKLQLYGGDVNIGGSTNISGSLTVTNGLTVSGEAKTIAAPQLEATTSMKTPTLLVKVTDNTYRAKIADGFGFLFGCSSGAPFVVRGLDRNSSITDSSTTGSNSYDVARFSYDSIEFNKQSTFKNSVTLGSTLTVEGKATLKGTVEVPDILNWS